MTTASLIVPGDSLRERKKAATRTALHAAALRLAVERGFAEVTVEAIADAADVSRRTFSNYFANKEDALLYGDRSRSAALLAQLRERPTSESPWQALRASALALYLEEPAPEPEWVAQLRLVRQHPALVAQQVGFLAALEQDLAAELVRRPGGPSALAARVMVASFLAAIRCAVNVWLEQQSDRELADLIRDALVQVAEPFR
ncbi:TetR family transcriptional regulator [Hamadaea tsunoensis]|uniref:TetR family transcriptional regulator n=1 Tax=Hamadaea tsunoensis TaxID=53368 RepID=UPI0004119AF9|nr:TetR family transcriptional regulator [Hamadaea tsunoensis]